MTDAPPDPRRMFQVTYTLRDDPGPEPEPHSMNVFHTDSEAAAEYVNSMHTVDRVLKVEAV